MPTIPSGARYVIVGAGIHGLSTSMHLAQRLKAAGVSTGVHYPIPLHVQPAYESRQIPLGSLPTTETAASEVISLPMYPELSQEQLESIVNAMTMAVVSA